jgi:16S rRNA (uracil1498-N3)-methyltransferase
VTDELRVSDGHLLVDDLDHPELTEEAEHHLTRVLRLRDGRVVTVTDGCGRWRACRLELGSLVVEGDIRDGADRPSITIAAAVPKGDRVDWMVQKLTELGVARIVLLRCERSVVNWEGERAERQLERLRRISIGALQQSRGVWMPAIQAPVAAAEVLPQMPAAEPGGDRLAVGATMVAIGPEGGWSESELAAAGGTVDLGPGVLRVETAAVTAAVLMTRVAS